MFGKDMGNKSTLPYELTYSEKPSTGSKNMKRLAVLVKPQNVNDIVSPLKEMGLEATIYDVRGVGKEKGERVASGRGSGTSEQAYSMRKVVATVVKSGDTNKVVEEMKKALGGRKRWS
jgi:nitrogen regulatory protein PII